MTMAYGEKQLRETGDPRDAVYADRIAAILEERGRDIPLPEVEAQPDTGVARKIGATALEGMNLSQEHPADMPSPSLDMIEREGEFAGEVQNMPQVLALIDKMYDETPSEAKRGWGRRFKSVEWTESVSRIGKLDTTYDHTLTYDTANAAANQPTHLEVVVGKEKRWDGIKVDAYQKNHVLTSLDISFKGADYAHAGLLPGFTERDEKGGLPSDGPFLRGYENRTYPPKNLDIQIELEAGKFEVWVRRKHTDGREYIDGYVYEPTSGMFEGRRNDSGDLPPENPEEFKAFVGRMLTLIPSETSV